MMNDRAHARQLPRNPLTGAGVSALVQKVGAGAAVYYVLAVGCIYLSRQPQNIATLWLPDAFASIYLLLMPRTQRIWLLAVLGVVIPLSNLTHGDPWRIAISFAPANLAGIVIATWLLDRHVQPRLAVSDPWHLLKALTLGGLLPVTVGASIAVMTVPVIAGTPLGPSAMHLWLSWVLSVFFGVATLLPLGLWILARGLDFSSVRRPPAQVALLLVGLLAWAALEWAPYSFVYVIMMLTFVALFGGFVMAAMGAMTASVVMNICFALGVPNISQKDELTLVFMVLPMLLAVIPTVLIGAIREGFSMQLKRISEGEAMQRSMLDASPNLLCLVNQEGRIVRMNQAGARMLGVEDTQALTGRPLSDFIVLDDNAEGERRAQVRSLQGRHLEAEWHCAPLPSPEHGQAAVYALRDLTADLEARRMREQATRSEAQSRAKSEFLSRISHELRTPLNAVLGFAQVMDATLETAPKSTQKQNLARITEAGWHLLAMIDDVLELSRLDAGEGAFRPQTVDLASIVNQACMMVQTEASRRAIHITSVNLEGIQVTADPLRLRQVFINLLSNAVKYNRESGTITVAAEPDGTSWRISVTDSGLGISPAQQAHVFEPFNRLDQEGSDITGTGIGLSITRKLMEAMNGSIGFVSEQGVGTTFWIILPQAQDALPLTSPLAA